MIGVLSDGARIVRADNPVTRVAPRTGPTTNATPKIVAWATAGILLLCFTIFLLTGTEKDQKPDTGPPPASAFVGLDETPSAAPTTVQEEPIAADIAALENETTPEVDATPPPDKQAPIEGIATNAIEPEPPLDIPPAPTEKPEVNQQAERERAMVAAIEDRLSLPLLAYESAPGMTLQSFLFEIEKLTATETHAATAQEKLAAVITLSEKNCALGELLSACLSQFDLTYTIRADGIHVVDISAP